MKKQIKDDIKAVIAGILGLFTVLFIGLGICSRYFNLNLILLGLLSAMFSIAIMLTFERKELMPKP